MNNNTDNVVMIQEQKDALTEKALCPTWRQSLLSANVVLERIEQFMSDACQKILDALELGNTARFKAEERALDKKSQIL